MASEEKYIPISQVREYEVDAWDDGYERGYTNGNAAWALIGAIGFVVGALFASVVT